MAFCKSCGQEIGDAGFCPKCGAAQVAGTAPAAVAVAVASDSPTAGIDENVAAVLGYFFMWIGGLVFLLIDKRPFVRFHAAQSLAFNIAAAGIGILFGIGLAIVTFITIMIHFPVGFLGIFLWPVIGIGLFLTWLFLMYKAYQHEMFKLPVIGNLVERMINK